MKKCIASRTAIDDDATICTTCNTHQTKWHSWLPYASGVAAVLALIGSLLTYITATSIDIFSKLAWNDDIQIISLRYGEGSRHVTVLNTGDGPVYLSHLSIKSKIPTLAVRTQSFGAPIDKVVPAHEFYTYDVTEDESRRERTEAIVSRVTDEQWNAMLENYEQDKCINLTYYAENDPAFIHWKSFLGDALRTFDATVEVTLISPKRGAVKSRAFSAKGVLHYDQRPECTNYDDNVVEPQS